MVWGWRWVGGQRHGGLVTVEFAAQGAAAEVARATHDHSELLTITLRISSSFSVVDAP